MFWTWDSTYKSACWHKTNKGERKHKEGLISGPRTCSAPTQAVTPIPAPAPLPTPRVDLRPHSQHLHGPPTQPPSPHTMAPASLAIQAVNIFKQLGPKQQQIAQASTLQLQQHREPQALPFIGPSPEVPFPYSQGQAGVRKKRKPEAYVQPGKDRGAVAGPTPLDVVLSRDSTNILRSRAHSEILTARPVVVMPSTTQPPKLISKATILTTAHPAMSPASLATQAKQIYQKLGRKPTIPTPAPAPSTTNVPTAELIRAIWAARTSSTPTPPSTSSKPSTTPSTPPSTYPTTTSSPHLSRGQPLSLQQPPPTAVADLVDHFQALDRGSQEQEQLPPPSDHQAQQRPAHPPHPPAPTSEYRSALFQTPLPSPRSGSMEDMQQVPSSRHQVIILGPHSLPETLDSLERVLSGQSKSIHPNAKVPNQEVISSHPDAIPSREEVLSILEISKEPIFIENIISQLDETSQENTPRSNATQLKPLMERAISPPPASPSTSLNHVRDKSPGLVGSSNNHKFHPRNQNAIGRLTEDFEQVRWPDCM